MKSWLQDYDMEIHSTPKEGKFIIAETLTHFFPMFPFYSPWKYKKTLLFTYKMCKKRLWASGILCKDTGSGGIKRKHWEEMD